MGRYLIGFWSTLLQLEKEIYQSRYHVSASDQMACMCSRASISRNGRLTISRKLCIDRKREGSPGRAVSPHHLIHHRTASDDLMPQRKKTSFHAPISSRSRITRKWIRDRWHGDKASKGPYAARTIHASGYDQVHTRSYVWSWFYYVRR